MAFEKVIRLTFRGDWKQRNEWAEAYSRLVVRTRALDTVLVELNDKRIEAPAVVRRNEIVLTIDGGMPGQITRVGIVSRLRSSDIFYAKLRPAVHVHNTNILEISILELPGAFMHYANSSQRSYAGNARIAKLRE